MKIRALNHVAIHVVDVEASARFYSEVLELETILRPDFDFPGAWFRLGSDQELHLIGGRTDESVVSGKRGTHFALEVDSCDDVAVAFEAKGTAFGAIQQRPDGATQMYVWDPDGYAIELCELPTSG